MTLAMLDGYKGYLGNSFLKKSGEEVEWTPDMLKEYLKCSMMGIYP